MIQSFIDSEYKFIASLYEGDLHEEEFLESDNVDSKEEVPPETSSDESNSSSTWSFVFKIGLAVAAIFAAYKLGSYVKNLGDVQAEVVSKTDTSEFIPLPLNRERLDNTLAEITNEDTSLVKSSVKSIVSLKKIDKEIQRKDVLSGIVVDCALYTASEMAEKAKRLTSRMYNVTDEVDSKTNQLFRALNNLSLIESSDIRFVSKEELEGLLSQNSHLWIKNEHLKCIQEFKKLLPDINYFIEEATIIQKDACAILKNITTQKNYSNNKIPEEFFDELHRLSEIENNAATFVEVMSQIVEKTDNLIKNYT